MRTIPFATSLFVLGLSLVNPHFLPAQQLSADKANLKNYGIPQLKVGKFDWPQWGGSSLRNNTPVGKNIPTDWDVETGKNIKWKTKLGSQTYPCPIVANGRVYIGTNNSSGYIERYPPTVDLGCLLCFDEQTGKFLWQHSNEKLPTGLRNDWPFQGVVTVPIVDGERLWYVNNRAEVVCLDTAGFTDDMENDGPFRHEEVVGEHEADVIWKYDMIAELGVFPHYLSTCSVTCAGDKLFVVTSNGVDNGELSVPKPNAAAFAVFNRQTGKLLWSDNSPGKYILNGSWSSPTYAVLGGQPQVLFPGGDGWLYSFDPAGDGRGSSKLLWKFDTNPKESKWILRGRGTRNAFISLPVVYDNKVYVAVGQNADHGEGVGGLWCIDPTKKLDGSDVSPTLAIDAKGNPLPRRRLRAADRAKGESEKPNPNSAVVWHYDQVDRNGNGEIEFEERMHRSCGSVAIKDDLLFIADFSGLVHCINAQTGKLHWTHDQWAASWAALPLIVDGKVYIGDEDGDVAIFELSKKKKLISEVNMGNALYSTPIVANNVLFVANKDTLYAIESQPNQNE